MIDLNTLLRSHSASLSNQAAIRFEREVISFAELDRRADRIASALTGSGVVPGQRVAYLGRNHARFFELLFGAARVGAVLTPINNRLTTPEVAHIISDSQARLLFVESALLPVAAPLIAANPVLQAISIDSDDYTRWRDASGLHAPTFAPGPETVALQLYTSGTTGKAKGVMITHRNLLEAKAVEATKPGSWNRWDDHDAVLVATPLAHIGATGWALWALFHGATAVVLSEFSAEGVLAAIASERITKMFLVPSALQIVARHPAAATTDFSALRIIMYGASPMPPSTLLECMEVFGCAFAQHYGMTETSGSVAILPPEDHSPEGGARMLAAGRPIGGARIVVRDADGKPAETGTIGEITVQGSAVMSGYWGLEQASRDSIMADGWLRTGDAGYLDADGYLYIADRLKDMIISGGENVYPTEVECVLAAHPGVEDVAVIGIPDERWGEAVHAAVVLRPGAEIGERELRDWCRERLAGFKLPKRIEFIAQLPRNASGKTDRRALREPFWEGRMRQVN